MEALTHSPSQLESLKERWEDSSNVQKLGLAAILCLVLASATVWGVSSSSGDYKPLFGRMSPTRAGQVVEKLEEMGQPYRLGGDGTIVMVPPSALNRLRLELAATGLLEEKEQGFELFESASLSRSDFSERVTYLRALQGELSSTISSIDKVSKARVHLNLSERPLFLDQEQQTSAAIYLEMAPGAKLNDNQIRGIIALVANSVDSLEKEQVTLFDSTGAIHISGSDLDANNLSEEDSEDHSQRLSKIAQSLVDRVLGPGRGLASVRVELNHDVRRVEKEFHQAGEDGEGVPIRREDTSELFEGTKPVEGAQEGVTTPQEIPNQQGFTQPKYTQTSTKVDFAVSKTTEFLEQKPGEIARISASVIVDSNVGLSEEQVTALAEGVKSAIGVRDDRGRPD